MGFDSKFEARIDIKDDQTGDSEYLQWSDITFNRSRTYSENLTIAPSAHHDVIPGFNSIQDIALFSNVPVIIYLQVGIDVVGPIQATSKFIIQGGDFDAMTITNPTSATGTIKFGLAGF